ncbi:hypothetical protein [Tateyamaria pelophila]|uniref:hypothetical protein n=1 Tax=Tateyamaria pelophila TaxID=328415 RepID=UPI001CBF848A|nr:hypothetical protein [Tateyamaria pelophila]
MNSIKVKLITFIFAFLMSASVSTMAQDYSTDMTQIADHFEYLSAEERTNVQEALSSLQLYTQTIDGEWGPGTSRAMVEALDYIDLTFGFQYDKKNNSWNGMELIFQILINPKLQETLYRKYVVGEGDECDGCDEMSGGLFFDKDKEVLQSWHFANSKCRGSSGDNPTTMMWCDVRSGIGDILRVQNFCYGRENEAGYQMEWHRCEE